MATGVARRVVLIREARRDAGVAAETGVEETCADQLLVAMRGVEGVARGALAVPARNLLVRQLAVLGGVAVGPGAVRKTQAFGPDAGVDDADDDAFTFGLRPGAAGCRQAKEIGRRRGVEDSHLVLRDRQHAAVQRQRCCLLRRQFSSEAAEGIVVAVQLARNAHTAQRAILPLRQIGRVADDIRAVGVDLLALVRLGRAIAGYAALVGRHGRLDQLNDVDVVLGPAFFSAALIGNRGYRHANGQAGRGRCQ